MPPSGSRTGSTYGPPATRSRRFAPLAAPDWRQPFPSIPSFLSKPLMEHQPAGPAVRGRRGPSVCLAGNLSVCSLSGLSGWSVCLLWLSGSLAVWSGSGSLSSSSFLSAKRQVSYESGHPSIQIEVETGFLGAGPLKIRFKVDFGPRGTLQSPPGVLLPVSRSSQEPQEAPRSLQRVD